MWGNIIKDLDGHRVAKIIYGSIIILVVLLAMEDHPPTPAAAIGTVLFTGLGVALAELYSDFIGTRIRERRILTWAERSQMTHNVGAVMIGALLPLPFFILAWLGFIGQVMAFILAKWILIGTLLFYGFVASKLSGNGTVLSFVFGFAASLIGLLVVLLKSAVGH
jgi:hypothetical protein